MKRHLLLLSLLTIPFFISAQAVITAVFDADLPGGLPKGVEIYLLDDIADMSMLGIGSANNGGGTDGVEFTFPVMSADSGSYFYVSSDSAQFAAFFGFDPDFTSDAMAINGDDAIELFWDSVGIDIFGEIDVDGTGQPWEYMDGWAARKAFTGPDGTTFVLQNWYFSGIDALDGAATNGVAGNPVPLKAYADTTTTGPDATVILQNLQFTPRDITIEVGQTVRFSNVEVDEEHNVNGLQSVYPCNPQGFYSGEAAAGPWDYDVTFNAPGHYDYQCDPHVIFDMLGTVTVIDPNAPDYPAYAIATVHTEDVSGVADSSGTECTLTGVVHGPNFRPSGLQFTLIDVGNSVGINVFKNSSDCYEVNEGDMISVSGTITQFNGLTEILPEAQIQVLSSGNALMVPAEVTLPLDEDMESTLVTVPGIVVDSVVATGSSGWNVFGKNILSNAYLVRLDADVFSDATQYEGKTIDVTGLVGQFDSEEPYTDGYQLQPRGPVDMDIQVSVPLLPAYAVQIAPNPVQSVLRITTGEQIVEVQVFSATGQHLLTRTDLSDQLQVSKLVPGEYVLRVVTEKGLWTGTFIKL